MDKEEIYWKVKKIASDYTKSSESDFIAKAITSWVLKEFEPKQNKAILIQELEISKLKERVSILENSITKHEKDFNAAIDSIVELSKTCEGYEYIFSKQNEIIEIVKSQVKEYKELIEKIKT